MPQRCRACTHPKRDAINSRLLRTGETGESLAVIGTAYGLTRAALDRHRRNHLQVSAGLVSEAKNALQIVGYASDLYERINRLAGRAEVLLDEPMGATDTASRRVTAAVAAIRELRQSIDQLAKLVVTGPPPAPEAGNSWLDAAIIEAVQAMAPAALPSGRALEPGVVEAEIVQAPD